MFNVGDTVLYGKEGVCVLSAIEKKRFGGETHVYYVLESMAKTNSKIYIPCDNEKLTGGMRRVLSEAEIKELVVKINEGAPIWESDENTRREEYRRTIADADCLGMGRCLRAIHYKKEELKAQGKKLRRFDEEFFIQGQNILFNEFSYVLKISKDEVLTYILSSEGTE